MVGRKGEKFLLIVNLINIYNACLPNKYTNIKKAIVWNNELRNLEKICHNMNMNGNEEAEAIEAARERLPAGAEGQKWGASSRKN